ncbi:hypothetical protein D3C81_1783360 [compost metagenome]
MFEGIQRRFQLGAANAQFMDQAMIAEVIRFTAYGAAHAAPGQCFKVADFMQGLLVLLRLPMCDHR